MTVLIVVQARMGSSRLPGKVLADLHGQPMLGLMLERLRPLDPVYDHRVVATTTSSPDDAIAELAEQAGWDVVRGDEFDVLSRFGACLDRFPADNVVRLTADCPLADPEVVCSTVRLHRERGADYTCNVLPRTFPQGLDAEVVTSAALRIALREARDLAEREHVTPFFYRRPERFKLANLRSALDVGYLRWTVDTLKDLERVRALTVNRNRAVASWKELLTAAKGVADTSSPRLRPARAEDGGILLAWRNDPVSVMFSTSHGTVEADEHKTWLRQKLDDPGCGLYILEAAGQAAGMVRVDVEGGVGTVSIAINPAHRGQGIGRTGLRLLLEMVDGGQQVVELKAVISAANAASIALFGGAGFQQTSRVGEIIEMRREAGPSRRDSPS